MCECVDLCKRVFQKLIVGPSPSEKPQGTKAEAGDVGSIVDAGRQSHGALQPGEARATFETPSEILKARGSSPANANGAKLLAIARETGTIQNTIAVI